MQPYENELFSAISSANTFISHANARGVDILSEGCGTDMAPIIQAVQVLSNNLNLMLQTLQETMTLTGCAKISPVMRKIFYGETCDECVNGLTWMFSSLFAICCSGMIMISLRAALYNARVEPSKYQERSEGNIDDNTVKTDRVKGKSSRLGIHGRHEITQVQSFDTGLTTQTSSQDSEDTLSHGSKNEEMKPLTPPPRLGGMEPIPEVQTPMEYSVADSIRDVDSMGSRHDEFMDEESIGSNSKKRSASSKGIVKSFMGRFGGGGIEMTPTQRIGMAPMSQIQTPLRNYDDDSDYHFSSPDSFASDESGAADMTMSSPSIFRTPQAPSKRVFAVRRLQNSYKK
jgi:hypothetical protein